MSSSSSELMSDVQTTLLKRIYPGGGRCGTEFRIYPTLGRNFPREHVATNLTHMLQRLSLEELGSNLRNPAQSRKS